MAARFLMPQDKDFKRKIRERMAATGERYTVARASFEQTPPQQPLWQRWIELLADTTHANGAHELLASLPADERRHAALSGLRHESWRVRRRCCQLLDDLTLTTGSVDGLVGCLDDPEPRVRQAALHSLSCVACKPDNCTLDMRPLFERMIEDPSAAVRRQIVGPMSWNTAYDVPWAEALLRRVVTTDPNQHVREDAAASLTAQERRRDLDRQRRELPDDLRRKTERHPGKWVAVSGGDIVTASPTPGQVRKQLRSRRIEGAALYWVAPPPPRSD